MRSNSMSTSSDSNSGFKKTPQYLFSGVICVITAICILNIFIIYCTDLGANENITRFANDIRNVVLHTILRQNYTMTTSLSELKYSAITTILSTTCYTVSIIGSVAMVVMTEILIANPLKSVAYRNYISNAAGFVLLTRKNTLVFCFISLILGPFCVFTLVIYYQAITLRLPGASGGLIVSSGAMVLFGIITATPVIMRIAATCVIRATSKGRD